MKHLNLKKKLQSILNDDSIDLKDQIQNQNTLINDILTRLQNLENK